MKVVVTNDLQKIEDFGEFKRFCSQAVRDLQDTMNGNLDFSNHSATEIQVVFDAADTEKKIGHNLNKIASKYLVIKKNVACDVYDSGTKADLKTIYLKCTQVATVTLLIF